ncbi:MAG: class I adenylate cyclase [Desulfobacterales bacterium]|nr:class I adenylate cyclase [Desulfobacterales bacterium]
MDPKSSARRIHWARKAFSHYNIVRLRELIQILPHKRLDFFSLAPFLLHVNHPDFPGYVDHPRTPCGIYQFHTTGFWKKAVAHFNLGVDDLRRCVSDQYWIDGLYLMGSVGTLAQTSFSDFDYWMLVDRTNLDDERLGLLNQKLSGITQWGADAFGQEVHFFMMDADQVRRNDFSSVDAESSGSAQKTILKEEFYRTFIVVAGRIPFWAVLPPGIGDRAYQQRIRQAGRSDHLHYDPDDYVDLGNLTEIWPQESLGAILWQIYKAGKDPVKSFLKASLIGHYHFFHKTTGLLCDVVKQRIQDSRGGQGHLDPYLVVFDAVLAFFEQIEDAEGLDLAKESVFLRLNGYPRRRDVESDHPARVLSDRFVRQWAWDRQRIGRLRAWQSWTEQDTVDFESRLLAKLSFLYHLISKHHDEPKPGDGMAEPDLTLLKNRMAAYFQSKPDKLPHCSSYLKIRTRGKALWVNVEPNPSGGIWSVLLPDSREVLFVGPALAGVIGWLIRNGIHPSAETSVRFVQAPPPFSTGRSGRILDRVDVFFKSMPPGAGDFALPPRNEMAAVFIHGASIRGRADLSLADFLVRNSWGEFFQFRLDLGAIENHWAKCYKIATRLQRLAPENPVPPFLYRMVPAGPGEISETTRLVEQIYATLKRTGSAPSSPGVEVQAPGPEGTKPMLDIFPCPIG